MNHRSEAHTFKQEDEEEKGRISSYFQNWRLGDEMRRFGSENWAGLGKAVVGEVTVYDECNLNRGHFSFAYALCFYNRFPLLHHFSFDFFALSGKLQKRDSISGSVREIFWIFNMENKTREVSI